MVSEPKTVRRTETAGRRAGDEETLLVLLNLASPDAATEERIRLLASLSTFDWREFRDLAELNAVVPLAWRNLRRLGLTKHLADDLREETVRSWDALDRRVRERAASRVQHGSRLLEEWARTGVDAVVLKGSLFAEVLYGDPAYKKMNDLDVLVRKEQVAAAVDGMRRTGFACAGSFFGSVEATEKHHSAPAFATPDHGCVVGLHWGLKSPRARWRPDVDGIWLRKSPVRFRGVPAWRMSWEDNLLHLCIQLPFFKTGLRELADVVNLVRFCRPAVDWPRFSFLVREARAEDAAYRVLRLADALVPLGIPGACVEAWRRAASTFTVADTDRRAADPGLVLRSRCDQVARIEKAFAVFRETKKYSERVGAWASMWRDLLWPDAEELPRLVGERALPGALRRFGARLAAPRRLWKALSRDYGSAPLALLTAINAGIVVRDTVLRPFRKDGPSLCEHPMSALLEVIE